MRTSPLRVALWCVVLLAGLVFISMMRTSAVVPQTVITQTMTTRAVTNTVTATPRSMTQLEAAYAGNVSTHKFHRLSCRYATCKNCTARFATRDEALAAGFRPGGCCDP